METNLLNLRKSINKAYLKVKPNRTQIETFKKNITNLFDQIKESESEEFHKNIISEFLKNTYYSPNNYINTKGRSDLVIHNSKDSNSTVGVLFEAKKPNNKTEMPTYENINTKAFHELILYFLRERITNKNIEVKHLVITNIFEWFIFDSNDFEKHFAEDKSIIQKFQDFESKRLSGKNTDFFYKNIAESFCKKTESAFKVTYFDIREFEGIIKNANSEDDNKLITLYKIFSPEHLLKLPFANDSNNLDKSFYNELLHIIGLEETKDGGKKIIGRKNEKFRDAGSLIENSITILKSEDCLTQISKLSDYGNDKEEQLFSISLELVITWINRILFLKLLEGQLTKYNNGDPAFRFLNIEKIHGYDELNKLFFQVLAVKEIDRNEIVKLKFRNIPFLNSSLFETCDLEHKTIRISNLDDHNKLTVLSSTVLKDKTGKKLIGQKDPLEYLFEFLDSYDFTSEGSEEIQEENKTIINASVLGLIFEKINGYKEGSFFTPGFITMYMCNATIKLAIVQKFNEEKGWKCESISDLFNKIEDIKEANKIINSIRICDPAVGSGHFLVSALNEIIAIKSELKILSDKEGKRLKEYSIEVVNDELIITDEQSILFVYNPKNKESQRVQEALFLEKQKLIENCLFGVDINPNSVKICRLRLWIELLKNAYYKSGSHQTSSTGQIPELETLPNIDINIKCGDSLINRYPLDVDIKAALKSSKWNVENYREAVMTYRNAQSKEEKRAMEQLIVKIKNDFETEVSKNDKRFLKLNKLKGELLSLTGQSSLFELSKTQKDEWNKKVRKLTEEINGIESLISEINSNKNFRNAFEWRFEFPEILNNDGEFSGFDIVIGNPPYIQLQKDGGFLADLIAKSGYSTYERMGDIYSLFYERGWQLLRPKGFLCFITSNKWMRAGYGESTRKFFSENTNPLLLVDFAGQKVFDSATVDTNILLFSKEKNRENTISCLVKEKVLNNLSVYVSQNGNKNKFNNVESWVILSGIEQCIKEKIERIGTPLKNWDIQINYGIKTGFNDAFIISEEKRKELIEQDPKSEEIIRPILRGRDIKRYGYDFANLWLINTHNGIKEKNINPIDINDYPAIKKHLDYFYLQLEKRADKGDTPYNLRNCAYTEDFSKQKILWAETMRIHKGDMRNFPRFGFEEDGQFVTDKTCFFATGNKLKFIVGVLNSSVGKYLCSQYVSILDDGGYLMQKLYLEKIPIAPYSDELEKLIETNKHEETETEINNIVYQLYDLNKEEITFIESLENQPLQR